MGRELGGSGVFAAPSQFMLWDLLATLARVANQQPRGGLPMWVCKQRLWLLIICLALFAALSCGIFVEDPHSQLTIAPTSTPAPTSNPSLALEPMPTPPPLTPTGLAAAGDLGRGTVENTIQALQGDQSARSFTIDFTSGSEDEVRGRWVVRYSDIARSAANWKASGESVDGVTGESWTFDSRYESTCLKQRLPEDKPWEHISHDGWQPTGDPDAWTPLVPLSFLLIRPTPDWELAGFVDGDLSVVNGPVQVGGMMALFTVYVDMDTFLVERADAVVSAGGGAPTYDVAVYGDYEDEAVSVHEDEADCLSRNQ